MSPDVSVIIPLYNKSGTILRAVNSVLRQNSVAFELIIVDDGSTDNPLAFLSGLDDDRIRYICQTNGGPGSARNRGAAEARAPLLAFLDADDEWRPDFLNQAKTCLDRVPDCAAYVCGYDAGSHRNVRPNKIASLAERGASNPPIHLDGPALKRRIDALHSSCIVIRRAVFHIEGGYYDRDRCTYGEDSYLWCRVLLNHDIFWDPAENVQFHVEDSSLGYAVTIRKTGRPISLQAPALRRAIRTDGRFALERIVKIYRHADSTALRQSGATRGADVLRWLIRADGLRERFLNLGRSLRTKKVSEAKTMQTSISSTQIWVLSLASAEARRDRFASRARDVGVEWRFFDALTVTHPDLSYNVQSSILHHGRPMQPGEIGCYSSHFAIWKAFLASDARQLIVLEDDVIVDWPGLRIVSESDIGKMGYDYIRLYGKKPGVHRVIARNIFRHSLYLMEMYERVYGTQGYILNRTGAEKFVATSRHILRPIDDQMDRYYENGVRNLMIFPPLLLEESVYSDIGTVRFEAPKWSLETLARFKSDRQSEKRAFRRALLKQMLGAVASKLGVRF